MPRSAPFYGRDLSVRGFGCPGRSGSWNQPQWLQRDNRTGDVGESRADLCLAWHPPLPRRRTAVTGVARAGVLGFVHGLLRSKRRRSRGRRWFGSEQTAPFSRRKVFSLSLDLLRRTPWVAADCLTLRGACLKLQNLAKSQIGARERRPPFLTSWHRLRASPVLSSLLAWEPPAKSLFTWGRSARRHRPARSGLRLRRWCHALPRGAGRLRPPVPRPVPCSFSPWLDQFLAFPETLLPSGSASRPGGVCAALSGHLSRPSGPCTLGGDIWISPERGSGAAGRKCHSLVTSHSGTWPLSASCPTLTFHILNSSRSVPCPLLHCPVLAPVSATARPRQSLSLLCRWCCGISSVRVRSLCVRAKTPGFLDTEWAQ